MPEVTSFTGFTNKAFELLEKYKSNNAGSNYKREEFDPLIRDQFKAIKSKLFPLLAQKLPDFELSEHKALSSHASRANTLYHHFWAAFYRAPLEKKQNDLQLFYYIQPKMFKFGLFFGDSIDSKLHKLILRNIFDNKDEFTKIVSSINFEVPLVISFDDGQGFTKKEIALNDFVESNKELADNGVNFSFTYSREHTVKLGSALMEKIEQGFKQLLPLYRLLLKDTVKTTTQKKSWIIAPGENAKFWNEWVNSNIITIGWDDLGELSKYRSREEIQAELKKDASSDSEQTNNSKTVFDFANTVQVGDSIFVKSGLNNLLGYGEITSEYIYDSTRNEHKNTRKVRWHKTGKWALPDGERFALKTLTDLTPYPDFVARLLETINMLKPVQKSSKPNEDIFLDEKTFNLIVETIKIKKNVILQGSPGVGKTFLAKKIAQTFTENNSEDQIELVQFHQSYSYEDFVEGYRPNENKGFTKKSGIFLRLCARAQASPNKQFFLIIDEINRGNMSRIFGELLMLIEADKRGSQNKISLTYSNEDEKFYVPENLYIIGTMNTADRSLAVVDYALRRRFAFFDIKPAFDTPMFETYMKKRGVDNTIYSKLLLKIDSLNKFICGDTRRLGPGFAIGHSYFCGDHINTNQDWLKNVFQFEIAPLIREYYFDDQEIQERLLADLLDA